MSKTFKAKVLVLNDNRMLVPGLWYEDDAEANPMPILYDALTYEVVLGAKSEPDWLSFEADDDGKADIVNVPYRLVGRQFAHGAVDVILIGGPLFDEAMSEQPTPLTPCHRHTPGQ